MCGLAFLPSLIFAQNAPLTQDSYVIPGISANYGSAVTLDVGGPPGDAALVQFDLTQLPGGTTSANISKATLTLFVTKLGSAGNQCYWLLWIERWILRVRRRGRRLCDPCLQNIRYDLGNY